MNECVFLCFTEISVWCRPKARPPQKNEWICWSEEHITEILASFLRTYGHWTGLQTSKCLLINLGSMKNKQYQLKHIVCVLTFKNICMIALAIPLETSPISFRFSCSACSFPKQSIVFKIDGPRTISPPPPWPVPY